MKIPVTAETGLQKLGDMMMLPLMYFLQLNLFETPQRTHFWNNTKFPIESLHWLDGDRLVSVPADETAVRRWLGYIPIFHMPIFGGWKRYVVIAPVIPCDEWFVGWIAGDTAGISNITLHTSVRLLQGSGPAQFFGADSEGQQIALRIVGYGQVGVRSEFSALPLL